MKFKYLIIMLIGFFALFVAQSLFEENLKAETKEHNVFSKHTNIFAYIEDSHIK